jgi:hypothetical protein
MAARRGSSVSVAFAQRLGGAAAPVASHALLPASKQSGFTYEVAGANGAVHVADAPASDPGVNDATALAALTCHTVNERPEPVPIVLRQAGAGPEPIAANLGPPGGASI